jgi:hypothetical protein
MNNQSIGSESSVTPHAHIHTHTIGPCVAVGLLGWSEAVLQQEPRLHAVASRQPPGPRQAQQEVLRSSSVAAGWGGGQRRASWGVYATLHTATSLEACLVSAFINAH